MKIATWNIGEDERNADGHITIDTYQKIADMINSEDLDVVCFQEAITTSLVLPPIGDYVAQNTPLKYHIDLELSDSYSTPRSKIGIVICSKNSITNREFFHFRNPNLVYQKSPEKIYYSDDKGFLMGTIEGVRFITGHCMPFYAFQKSPLDYLDIFSELDQLLIKQSSLYPYIIFCGDINYENPNQLFPEFTAISYNIINEKTRKEKQWDHLYITRNLEVQNVQVLPTISDHKICIAKVLKKA